MASKNTFRTEANRLQKLLVESQQRERLLRHALGEPVASTSSVSPQKDRVGRTEKDDMFVLPPMPDSDPDQSASSSQLDQSTSSVEETEKTYNVNLQTIDVTSKHFLSLPADVRHEILTDIKGMRKQSSWGRLHELPEESSEFSGFQMQRLLNRRRVQVSLDEAEQEMGGKSMSFVEIEKLLREDGVVEAADLDALPMRRVLSDENARYLHVRNLKKVMRDEERLKKEERPECSPPKKLKVDPDVLAVLADIEEDEEGDNEDEDVQLQRAILMSKEEDKKHATDLVDIKEEDEEDEDEQLQRAIQMSLEDCQVVEAGPSSFLPKVEIKTEPASDIHEISDAESDVSSNADSDFIDVPDPESDTSLTLPSLISFELNIAAPPDPSTDFRHEDLRLVDAKKNIQLEVVVDPDRKPSPGDDLFADVFQSKGIVDNAGSVVSFPDVADEDMSDVQLKVDPTAGGKSPGQLMSILDRLNAEMDSLVELDKAGSGCKTEEAGSLFMSKDETTATKSILTYSKDDKSGEEVKESKDMKSKDSLSILNQLNAEMDELVRTGLNSFKNSSKDPLIDSKDVDTGNISSNESKDDAIFKVTPTQDTSIETIQQEEDVLGIIDSSSDEADSKPHLTLPKEATITSEVIEIDDNDDETSSPKKLKQQGIASFIQVTPKKPKSTAELPIETTPPKVASPFFRKKTPTSSSSKKNHHHSEHSSPHSNPPAKKSLFPEPVAPPKTHAQLVDEVADELRHLKSAAELAEMADASRQTTRDLLAERNKQDRLGTSITDRMSDDCKRLLRMFGVPFVVAPMEAEAQCAYLDAVQLTDGTITDDSDIWLFGGRTVYKHFFDQDKSVQEFRSEAVKRLFKVERGNLIQMAMLVGSDYTTGVTGVGMVTAMEILSTFTGGTSPGKEDGTCDEQHLLTALRKFKEWMASKTGSNVRLRTKLKNVSLADDFPSSQVVQSYLYPEVNEKLAAFTWRAPDTETLREFAKTTFGWTFNKTDETLQPVLKRLQERKSQVSIRNYFATQGVVDRKEIAVSKRVRKAIDQMTKTVEDKEKEEAAGEASPVKPKRTRKPKAVKVPAEETASHAESGEPKKAKRGGRVPRVVASTSSNSTSSGSPLKGPRVPDFQPPIPQRELAEKEQQEIRAKAAAVFKEAKKRNASAKRK